MKGKTIKTRDVDILTNKKNIKIRKVFKCSYLQGDKIKVIDVTHDWWLVP